MSLSYKNYANRHNKTNELLTIKGGCMDGYEIKEINNTIMVKIKQGTNVIYLNKDAINLLTTIINNATIA